MIEGVKIKKLKCIPDKRGFLMEMLRSDDELFKGFGQVYITGCKKGIAKGWHYHKLQTDNFICVLGKALVPLYDLRENSKTKGEVNEFIIKAPLTEENLLLQIPPGVVHGFTPLDCDEIRIINIPNFPYKYDSPDEYRYSWNSKEIPFIWPDFVVDGG
jgi:dTDP-4-dehydrorhamnose 3,5-epimerase